MPANSFSEGKPETWFLSFCIKSSGQPALASVALPPCLQFGVMLEGVALFDPAALGISEAEAGLMDPQQRLLLETASEALLARPAEAADEALRAHWGVFVVGGWAWCGGSPPHQVCTIHSVYNSGYSFRLRPIVTVAARSFEPPEVWGSAHCCPCTLQRPSPRASPPTTTTASCPSTCKAR